VQADHGGSAEFTGPGPGAAAEAKLEQIRDLYLTAEAIGEDALSKHFDQLRQRQRSLIAEYFSSLRQRPPGSSTLPGDDRP